MKEMATNQIIADEKTIKNNTQTTYEKICQRIIDNHEILEEDPVLGPTNLDDPITTRLTISARNIAKDNEGNYVAYFKVVFFDGEEYLVDPSTLKAALEDDGFTVTDNLACQEEEKKEFTISIPSDDVKKLKSQQK